MNKKDKKISKKDIYAKQFADLAKKKNKIPSAYDMGQAGVNKGNIQYHFGGVFGLEKYAKKKYPEIFQLIASREERAEEEREKAKVELIDKYIKLGRELKRFPVLTELKHIGVSRANIRTHFQGIGELKETAKAYFPKKTKDILDIDKLITPEKLKRTERNVKNHNRFVVSSITKGPAKRSYLKSIYNYCKRNKARLVLVMTKMRFSELDTFLIEEYMKGNLDIAFHDIRLHKKLQINSIKIDEKVVKPTAGIARYQNGRASFIYGSPKQTCKPVATKKESLPRVLMSPGAITAPNYIKDDYNRAKRDVMAENDHIVGAIIVEKDGDIFHTRPTQITRSQGFMDMGVEYLPNGKYRVHTGKTNFIMGDLHSRGKNDQAFHTWLSLMKNLKVKAGVAHDIFDCTSLNPHERHNKTMRVALELEDNALLSEEVQMLVDDIRDFKSACKKLYIVDSNHDDMLRRAFDSGLIWEDSRNAFIGSLLHPYAVLHNLREDYTERQLLNIVERKTGIKKDILTKKYPELHKKRSLLEYACKLYGLDSDKEGVTWLNAESSLLLGGFECADHGHKGVHGARGSLMSSSRAFVKKITGHTHVEEQVNFLFSVGHTSDNPRYARGGLSGWTTSSILVYDSGEAQSLRIINGKYRSFKDAFIPREMKTSHGAHLNELKKINKTYKIRTAV